MAKKNKVYISRVMFPWETFIAAGERETREIDNDGERWTPEFLAEVRRHIDEYAAITAESAKVSDIEAQAMRNGNLQAVWKLTPCHFRDELFAGIYLPAWVTETQL